MIKARKPGKIVGRRSKNEKMIEDFLNGADGLKFGSVFVEKGIVITRREKRDASKRSRTRI